MAVEYLLQPLPSLSFGETLGDAYLFVFIQLFNNFYHLLNNYFDKLVRMYLMSRSIRIESIKSSSCLFFLILKAIEFGNQCSEGCQLSPTFLLNFRRRLVRLSQILFLKLFRVYSLRFFLIFFCSLADKSVLGRGRHKNSVCDPKKAILGHNSLTSPTNNTQ